MPHIARLIILGGDVEEHPGPNGSDLVPLPALPGENWTVHRCPEDPNKFFYYTPTEITGRPIYINKPSRMTPYIKKGLFPANIVEKLVFKSQPSSGKCF